MARKLQNASYHPQVFGGLFGTVLANVYLVRAAVGVKPFSRAPAYSLNR